MLEPDAEALFGRQPPAADAADQQRLRRLGQAAGQVEDLADRGAERDLQAVIDFRDVRMAADDRRSKLGPR